MSIEPLETAYKGYRFRSRLEARWAVLLDELSVKWAYEAEGFDLDGVWYLPDFWIKLVGNYQKPYPEGTPPECGFWLEIKPTEPDADAIRKCERLSQRTGHNVYLAAGSIGLGEFQVYKWHPRAGLCPSSPEMSQYDFDPERDFEDFEKGHSPYQWDALNFYLFDEASPYVNDESVEDERVIKRAYAVARGARFEARSRE
jgi:hypothetical protein